MGPIVKKVLFGARQEAVLTPKEGYEVESVEVWNKTTNELVPSQLTKTSDNPPQWTCAFYQPAGVVSIRPKMKPIYYSVIIEECENCYIVLMESNDVVDVKVSAVNNADAGPSAADISEAFQRDFSVGGAQADGSRGTAEGNAWTGAQNNDGAAVPVSVRDKEDDVPGSAADVEPASDTQENDANFNEPQHFDDDQESYPEGMNVEDDHTEGSEEQSQDCVYDAGEFQEELEDIEPTVISREEYDKKCASYWQHHKAHLAGQIDEQVYNDVLKKHNAFMDDISTGRIVIAD